MENNRYLLVWEIHPDEVRFYSLPVEEVEAERFTLEHANGVMVNCVDDNDEYAARIEGYVREAYQLDSEGKWARFRLDVSELPGHPFLGVFHSGFLL